MGKRITILRLHDVAHFKITALNLLQSANYHRVWMEGGLMDSFFPLGGGPLIKDLFKPARCILNNHDQVGNAQQVLINMQLPYAIVVNDAHEPRGIITLNKMLLSEPTATLEDVCIKDVIMLNETQSLYECIVQIKNKLVDNTLLKPVIVTSVSGQLLGTISPNCLLTLLVQEAEKMADYFKTTLDQFISPITIIDKNGRYIFFNKLWSEIHHLGLEVLGKDTREFYPDVDIIGTIEKREKVIPEGIFFQTKEGKFIQPGHHPLINESDEVLGLMAVAENVFEYDSPSKHLMMHLEKEPFKKIIHRSPLMKLALYNAQRIAKTDGTVILYGESGVGKELFARAIHLSSNRKEAPMVSINCAAIPDELIESELFGYEGGAFTGASRGGKKGKFEQANGGTLFLDEIGNANPKLQSKILRALQEMEFDRIGGTKSVKVNTRIIVATNTDLETLVKEGKFRSDLYYRLNIFKITIPPLRERPDDIGPLIKYFLEIFNEKYHKNISITDKSIKIAKNYCWPGNVRELMHFVERLVVLSDVNIIFPSHPSIVELSKGEKSIQEHQFTGNLPEQIKELEKASIRKALEICNNNRTCAIKMLGISRKAFYSKYKAYFNK